MNYLIGIWENRILVAALTGWLVAQLLKTLLYLIINRELNLERLVGSGGMPSSHAATVCALATMTARVYGTNSFQFAVAAVLAMIVLYDARGVRLETGKQAVTINNIMEYLTEKAGAFIDMPKKELKELVGHTPLQVAVGSFIGIMTGLLYTP